MTQDGRSRLGVVMQGSKVRCHLQKLAWRCNRKKWGVNQKKTKRGQIQGTSETVMGLKAENSHMTTAESGREINGD